MITILCFTYNHADFIEDAIKGFMLQRCNFPFEIVIHDDASTDGTKEIIKHYALKYPRIVKIIIQDSNKFSLNPHFPLLAGLSAVSGDFVALCEGDDYWIDENKLQKQVEFLLKNKDYSMCIHNAIVVNRYSNKNYLFNKLEVKSEIGTPDVILKPWFSPTASFLFRKSNIDMPPSDVNGDIFLLFQMSLFGKIHYSEDVMSVYNYGNPGSLTNISMPNKLILYKKKFALMRYIDVKTKNKYLMYTSIVRIRLIMHGIIYKLRSFLKYFSKKF